MSRSIHFALPLVLCAPVLAQKVEFGSQGTDEAHRISITSQIQLTESRKLLVDGEEGGFGGRGGRGRRGGGGPTAIELSQEIVFDEGPEGSTWRQYHKLVAKETRTGRDGEPRESSVEGALQGKKVYLRETDAGIEIREGEADDAEAMPAVYGRGVPRHVSLAGLLPDGAVEIGDEYDLDRGFLTVLRGLVHPVTPERADPGEGGRGPGGRGGRGGRGAGRSGGGAGSSVIQLIANGKLDTDATGKVLRVEEVDGEQVAVLALTARLTGKGDAGALGLGPPAGRGRGGFGAGESKVDAGIDIEGTARVRIATGLVTSVELTGKMGIQRDTERTMSRGGDEREIQTLTEIEGHFRLSAACEPVKQ